MTKFRYYINYEFVIEEDNPDMPTFNIHTFSEHIRDVIEEKVPDADVDRVGSGLKGVDDD